MMKKLIALFAAAILAGSFIFSEDAAVAASSADSASVSNSAATSDSSTTAAPVNLDAVYQQAEQLYSDNKIAEALPLFQQAADGGQKDACRRLGLLYYDGEGVERDYAKVWRYLQISADAGDAASVFFLAECTANGWGIPAPDKEAAFKMYNTICGIFPYADVRVAQAYESGIGVAQDMKAAVEHYTVAADSGVAEAQYKLGVYYKDGIYFEKNDEKAFSYLSAAAEKIHAAACLELAYYYANGIQTAQDYKKALQLFEFAAMGGYLQGYNMAGGFYVYGLGCEKNTENHDRGLLYWGIACKQNYAPALLNAGMFYLEGDEFTKPNKEYGTKLLQQAADLGSEEAKQKLASLQ